MRPKREPEQPQQEMFQIDLEQLIDKSHPLVRLGLSIDWSSFEQTLGETYPPSQGAPGISTRLMVALHYLKYRLDLSDEEVVAAWVENPYWQHFIRAFWRIFLFCLINVWNGLLTLQSPQRRNTQHQSA